jgi:hypothetical protein
MKTIAAVAILFLVLAASFAVTPALANGIDEGKTFTIAVSDLPDICPVDASMNGAFTIRLRDEAYARPMPVTVRFIVKVETPFGQATLNKGSVKLAPGAEYTIPIAIPVRANTPLGDYRLVFTASTAYETLSVDHKVTIVKQ